MKRLLTLTSISLFSAPVFALDATPLFSVYVGAGAWSSELSGSAGSSETSVDELGLAEDDISNYFYAAFEHPIPVLPNLRLEHTSLSLSGEGTLTADFVVNGNTISGDQAVSSELDLSFTDLSLYYEVAVFDFGITLRQIDLDVFGASQEAEELQETVDEGASAVIPMAYVQTRISLPLTGIYITGAGHALSVGDNSMTDLRAAVGFESELSFLARFSVEAGYRVFDLELSDDTDLESNVELAGPFFGLDLKF